MDCPITDIGDPVLSDELCVKIRTVRKFVEAVTDAGGAKAKRARWAVSPRHSTGQNRPDIMRAAVIEHSGVNLGRVLVPAKLLGNNGAAQHQAFKSDIRLCQGLTQRIGAKAVGDDRDLALGI